ncbi:MAG: amidohydrolase family protein [Phycisphaerales bacterium]|jgi:cytosine/adenosine deaminase-related metal-dependent hydrolase|nr:amidohydrolase family protein [Phycisphaerales bacterium]
MVETCGEPVHKRRLIHAGGVIDAFGLHLSPAAVLVDGGVVRAVGSPASIGRPGGVVVEDWAGSLLMPGLVNAHAHLDLSGAGVWPPAGEDFRGWVGRVRDLRAAASLADVRAAVSRGIDLSLAGGTACIGDIAGHPPGPSIDLLRASPLRGTSFIECFGIGRGQAAALRRMQETLAAMTEYDRGIRIGISPHAPYSCGPEMFAAAATSGRPVMTHLAETPAELELLQHGSGPLRDMLEHDIGVWDAEVTCPAAHPVDVLLPALKAARAVCVHVNWLEPAHVDTLAAAGARVVYCPRASAAFGHAPPRLPRHPWAALRAAGVRVGLGTDSLLCLDTPDRISVLDDMRLLRRRDGVDGLTLLDMATRSGADVLDLRPDLVRLGPQVAGLLAVPCSGVDAPGMLEDALSRSDAPVWAVAPSAGAPQGGATPGKS